MELAAAGGRCPVGMDGRVFCAEADETDTVIVHAPDGAYAARVGALRSTGRMQLGPGVQLKYAGIS